jgi:hypothetical protein
VVIAPDAGRCASICRKLVVSLGILGLLAVNSQIPFAVFGKAVEVDVFAFFHGGRLMLAPCVSLVEYESSFVD